MALTHPTAPRGTQRVVVEAVQRAAQSGIVSQKLVAAMTVGGAAGAAPAAPHQVFVLGLSDIAANRGIVASAKPVGWRVLVVDSQSALAAVEFQTVAAPVGGAAPTMAEFKAFNQGRFVGATAEAIRFAESSPQVQQNDYEVRLIQVPGIYLVALWLHRPDDDLFLPLAPAPDQLRADQFYSEQDLQQKIQPLAQQSNLQDNRPTGTPP